MPITFKQDNILPNQQENKTGNLSQMLYARDVDLMKKSGNVSSLGSELEKTNPYGWNSKIYEDGQGFEKSQWSSFMNQSRLSTYYQDNPWEVLKHSQMNGYDGQQLGGNIRGNIPPGYLPGNTLDKPSESIKMQMKSRETIKGKESFGKGKESFGKGKESFGNFSFKDTKNIKWN